MAGEYLPPVVTRLTGDEGGLLSAIERAKAAIKTLKDAGTTVPIKFDVDTRSLARARTYARQLQAALPDGTIPIKFDVNQASVAKAVAASNAVTAATNRTTNPARWRRWLTVIHNVLTIFGANLVADTIGIIAFGAGAVAAFAPVVEAVGNLGATYAYLSPLQKNATVQITDFLNRFESANQTGIFSVFTQLLNMVSGSIGRTGGIMDQATHAFENFAAMLRQSFSSTAWAQVFSRDSHVIQTDLDALFTLLNNLINTIPALFHDFNGLGLAFLSTTSFLLHLIAVVGDANPALVRLGVEALIAYRALKLLGAFNSTSFLRRTISGFAGLGTAAAAGAAGIEKNIGFLAAWQKFGLGTATFLVTGLTPAVLGLGAAALLTVGGVVALAVAIGKAVDPTQQMIARMTAADRATGDNAAGYEKLAQSLGAYSNQLNSAGHRTALVGQALGHYVAIQGEVSAAQQRAAQTAQTINTNLSYLEHTYGLTQEQAYQLAKATGVDLTKGFAKGGGSAQVARLKIQAYEQTVRASQNPTSALAYDMGLAANKALALNDRVTALTNALNVMLAPLGNTLTDSVTWKQDMIAVADALRKSKGATDLQSSASRSARAALGALVTQTVKYSQDILTQTGSVQKAMGPLRQMISMLERQKNQSAATRLAIAALKAQIDALHSKTITVRVNQQVSGGGNRFMTGFAAGTPAAPPGWAWTGERGPELVKFKGGEIVLPSHVSMRVARGFADGAAPPGFLNPSLTAGSGGHSVIERQPIAVYIDGKKLFDVIQQRTFGYNVRNNNRTPRGSARGVVSNVR